MYDCSKQLEKFYRKKVVLSAKEQNELREKRKLNIKRLKDGLSEYNSEKIKIIRLQKKEFKEVWLCTLLLKMINKTTILMLE